MEIYIQRKIKADAYWIDGTLSIDGSIVCATLENAQYALPTGRYTVSMEYSEVYDRKVPVLVSQNDMSVKAVIGFGNGVYTQKTGTVIVGEEHVPGLRINSFRTFCKLYNRIMKSICRGNKVLVIIE